jgi:hypothetical protein
MARPALTSWQLETLVSPVALYPDPLLGQALAASTYPLELVEAAQWIAQHRDLEEAQLISAAKQMNWEASVQAMVAFPDALRTLTQNVAWTTDLGNAFLSQQAEVMDAIQRLRARAWQNGRLTDTPEQVVTSQNAEGRNAVVIQPANPQVMYVPAYNPSYVWGRRRREHTHRCRTLARVRGSDSEERPRSQACLLGCSTGRAGDGA